MFFQHERQTAPPSGGEVLIWAGQALIIESVYPAMRRAYPLRWLSVTSVSLISPPTN